MTAPGRWAVVEFDGDRAPIWTWGPYTEAEARERFEFVLHGRSQRTDVVLRTRSAALLQRGSVVEGAGTRQSRRAPLVGNKRLHHLDVDTREQMIDLELLATRLLDTALRKDGTPRIGPGWDVVRAAVCRIWRLVRGYATAPVYGPENVWWLQEWTCLCSQVEHTRTALHDRCPYHDAPTLRDAVEILEPLS